MGRYREDNGVSIRPVTVMMLRLLSSVYKAGRKEELESKMRRTVQDMGFSSPWIFLDVLPEERV